MNKIFFGILIAVAALIIIFLIILSWVTPADPQEDIEDEHENGEE